MNENIDLTKILKGCPKGTKLYSLVHGEVEFQKSDFGFIHPIVVKLKNGIIESFTSNGKLFDNYDGECIFFPSKDQRDWSKFTAPWYKKERFDPKTLKPFDKVLVRNFIDAKWMCNIFSHIQQNGHFMCINSDWRFNTDWRCCIPYNDETKRLVGTTDKAPEFYRYWED